MKQLFLTVIVAIFFAAVASAQTLSFTVKPIQTDFKYKVKDNNHYIVRNSSTHNNKLILYIGGTSSKPDNYTSFCKYAASLGFDVISLSYPNSVAANSLANNTDSMAFNKYRQEICFGTPQSGSVDVDTLNSIYTRTLRLIQYLAFTNKNQSWGLYLKPDNTLNWSKIIVAGHSQGAGHACYLAKRYNVERVLMFSGPNDYSAYYKTAANWLRKPGVTAVNKHFALLHIRDEIVPFSQQINNLRGLGMMQKNDTTLVDNKTTPYSDSHCLYTNIKYSLLHSATIGDDPAIQAVWKYMLTAVIKAEINIERRK